MGGRRRGTVGVERTKNADARPVFRVPKEVIRCLFLVVMFCFLRVCSMVVIPLLLFEIKLCLSDLLFAKLCYQNSGMRFISHSTF